MADAADKAGEDEQRAMALFEQQQARIAASMRSHVQPDGPIDCLECGEPVSVERQRAYPHTRRCVVCANAIETANGWGSPR